MNHETFFENLELLADAPNGVQKLREMVLSLAVQGKLVPQNSEDESAAVLFEKINLEKDRLLRENKIKNKKQLPLIEPEELPFDLPNSWKWMRLGEVVDYNGALKVSPNKIPDDSWLLELEDIEKDTSKIIKRVLFRVRKSKSTKTKFENGDVLYGKLRPYLNKVVIADDEGFCTTEIIPLHGYFGIFPKYLMYSLKRPDFLKYVNSKTYGINLPRLGTEDARTALFPLPPFEEQKHIVAKVDQLMALCDELEVRQQKKHEKRILLNNAALNKLLTAPMPGEFAQHWQRVSDNFDLLYDAPETVGQLRQAILQLAVQGKLVAQDPGDEPAGVLVEEIKDEREKLIKEKKIKKLKSSPSIENEEIPYNEPQNWEWIRLRDLGEFCGGGTPSKNKIEYWDGDIHWFSPKDMKNKHVNKSELRISNNALKETRLRKIPVNSILMVARSGILKRCFPVCINDIECTVNQDIKVLIPFIPGITEFLQLMLKGHEQFILEKLVKGGMTVQSLKYSEFEQQPFPLPPFEEQKRIVAKVDQLMSLCDELEAGLVQAQTDGGKLMEAVVHHVLEV